MKIKFNVQFLPESLDFVSKFNQKEKEKIYRSIDISRRTAKQKFIKKLNSEIYSFRVNVRRKQVRFLAFKLKSKEEIPTLIITHGFIKKKGKIPLKELAKAAKIRNTYLSEL